jgi:hypothetical protein
MEFQGSQFFRFTHGHSTCNYFPQSSQSPAAPLENEKVTTEKGFALQCSPYPL